MSGINLVILLGNLGKDIESRNFPDGSAVANTSLATSDIYEGKEYVEWHNIVFKARLAEIAAQYLKKGSKIYVEGRNKTRKWQDKEGKDHYTTEVHVRKLEMLDGKQAGSSHADDDRPQQRQAQPTPEAFDDEDICF